MEQQYTWISKKSQECVCRLAYVGFRTIGQNFVFPKAYIIKGPTHLNFASPECLESVKI